MCPCFQGADLNIAAEKSEVTVTIGTSPCNVTTFSQVQIVCKLPSTQPQSAVSGSGESDRKALPYVKVFDKKIITASVACLNCTLKYLVILPK